MQQPKLIKLPKFTDPRGNLSFLENENQIPFKIARSYWIYDVPGGETRGGHAFKENDEFIIALSGAFDVVLDNGKEVYCCSGIVFNDTEYAVCFEAEKLDLFAEKADVVLLVVGEDAYAEWYGDTEDMELCGALGLDGNSSAIKEAAELNKPELRTTRMCPLR